MTSRAKAIFNSSAAQNLVNSSVYFNSRGDQKRQNRRKWSGEKRLQRACLQLKGWRGEKIQWTTPLEHKLKWRRGKRNHTTVHLLLKMKIRLLLLNTTSIQTRGTQPPKCILLFKGSTIGANSSKASALHDPWTQSCPLTSLLQLAQI